MTTSATTNVTPALLTNGSLTFAPDFTGLQTYTSAVANTWTPTPGSRAVVLPQVGLWIGEPGLGAANAIGHIENATQTINPEEGIANSQFSAEGCTWDVASVVNQQAAEIAFRIERTPMDRTPMDDGEAARPEYGIFLAMPGDELGSMTVTQPPGAHSVNGAHTYQLEHTDGSHRVDFFSLLTVNHGSAQDLGLNEVAIFAEGPVLDVVIRFTKGGSVVGTTDDFASEASADSKAAAGGTTVNVSAAVAPPLNFNPNRGLSADPAIAPIAREIYQSIKGLPIVSMHGHVPVEWFAENTPFPDPAQLLIVPDHYLLRMLFSQGLKYEDLGVPTRDGSPVETNPREIWRRFCANWKAFRGTPTRFWMEHVLHEVFGVRVRPSAETADQIYDQIEAEINSPDFRPRQLLDRFNIEVIATTDPAWSDLALHKQLAAEGYGARILPTMRPDAVFALKSPNFAADVLATGRAAGIEITDYASFLAALREQRLRFKAAGATATDHGQEVLDIRPMPDDEAAALFDAAFAGGAGNPAAVSDEQARAFESAMMFEQARMASEDGLVMQIHPGVLRSYSPDILEKFGTDKGFDIPIASEYVRGLKPMLNAFGHNPNFRCIIFAIDEDVYTRELAPLAGVYPSLRLGAPWWFIDTPEAMLRFRESATETAGFYNASGFVDDTRAFCSIPARHDLARRIDATYLARLVAEGRLDMDEALETAQDLTYNIPKLAYAPPK